MQQLVYEELVKVDAAVGRALGPRDAPVGSGAVAAYLMRAEPARDPYINPT